MCSYGQVLMSVSFVVGVVCCFSSIGVIGENVLAIQTIDP